MAQLIPGDLDFRAYMRDTETRVKVRKASAFTDDLVRRAGPEQREERHPAMLLAKLRRGLHFRPGEVTCWAGYNGHRKSMFTGQAALDLCLQGQKVLVASMEMSPTETLWRMARQALGVEFPTSRAVQQFAEWTDGRLWMFDHVGRLEPGACLAVSRYFADELRGNQAFIDSMMMVCASEESLDAQKQFMTDLVRSSQETGLHTHLIAHCRKPQTGEGTPPTKYDLRGSAAISDQSHNVITVWANKAKKAKLDANPMDTDAQAEHDALVTVEKQRNGRWEGRVKLWFHDPSLRFMDDRTSPVEPYAMVPQ